MRLRIANRYEIKIICLILGMTNLGCSGKNSIPVKQKLLPVDWKTSLEFDPLPNGVADERSIAELESQIGVPLPSEYREFLMTIGGGYVRDGLAGCTCPTPFGECNITEFHEVKDVVRLLDSTIAPRNLICIGSGHFGMTICLSIAGLDHGQVFALDTEMRYYKWNEEALSRLPHLDASIKEFFRLRDANELSERPWGYENCYHVADSFSEFLSKLHASK
jgi:hypothetical protein